MANIKDVAKKAHVSVATVSRVINNKGYVNEETKQLVLNAIKELKYVPNEFARSLFNKTSRTIGVIVPHLNNPFYLNVLEGIEDIAFQHGFKVMLCNSQEDIEREHEYIKTFMKYNIDGIIIGSNSDDIGQYTNLKIPIVSIDRILTEDIPSVTSDNETGGRLAAQKLYESGSKNIAHFRGPSFLHTVIERTQGFNEFLSDVNLTCKQIDLAFIYPESDLIYNFLQDNPEIDGIFAESDYIAAQTLIELQKLGRRVPEDVNIIGYDNLKLTEFTSPQISTISQPMYQIGAEAMNLLTQLLDKEKIEAKKIILPVEYIKRESTK